MRRRRSSGSSFHIMAKPPSDLSLGVTNVASRMKRKNSPYFDVIEQSVASALFIRRADFVDGIIEILRSDLAVTKLARMVGCRVRSLRESYLNSHEVDTIKAMPILECDCCCQKLNPFEFVAYLNCDTYNIGRAEHYFKHSLKVKRPDSTVEGFWRYRTLFHTKTKRFVCPLCFKGWLEIIK